MRHKAGFCPANICFDPFTILAVTAVAATGASVAGGIASGQAQKKAASQSADLQEQQASLALDEAQTNAGIVANDRRDLLRRQALAYTKSGVALEGSPLLVLENTRSKSQQEVDAIVKSGAAQYKLGMANAATTRTAGRAALTSSYIAGAGQVASTATSLYSAGMFNASANTAGNTLSKQTAAFGGGTKPYTAPRF